ncbi:MAG: LysM peptidoglycan-binding domain-containing protein [Deltaproteobacteria bacterium]|nr:LysM peptidoglycan-binding domain-containing protein [Deltaproteobacteria bacterium]
MKNQQPFAYASWIKLSTRALAISVLLSGGVTACSSDEIEPTEVVAPAYGSDYQDSAPLDVTAPSDGASASTDATSPSDTASTAGDSAVADMTTPAAETASAIPSETLNTGSDTVKAELTDSVTTTGDSVVADSAASDTSSIFDGSVQPTDPGDVQTISSPGAAQNLPGKTERRGRGSSGDNTADTHPPLKKSDSSQYVIEPGDTLATISKKIYGTAKRWQELAHVNGLTDANRIYAGDVIRYDVRIDKAKAFAKTYNTTMKTFVVKKGDSLSKIAAQTYGSPDAWPRLMSFNREKIKDPHHIPVGLKLEYMEGGKFAALPKLPGPLKSPSARGKAKSAPTH